VVLTLELSAETQARLLADAEARGISLETYVRMLVEEAAGTSSQSSVKQDRREAVRSMLAFATKNGFTLGGGVRIKDLIHEGHKL
jgi:hypothetical protein